MDLIARGTVNHSGTFNSNVMVMAATLATLELLEREDTYTRLFAMGTQLMDGIRDLAEQEGAPVRIDGPGPMFHLGFTDGEAITDYRSYVQHNDAARGQRFAELLLDQGIRYIPRGLWYLSIAHTQEDIDATLKAVPSGLRAIAARPPAAGRPTQMDSP